MRAFGHQQASDHGDSSEDNSLSRFSVSLLEELTGDLFIQDY